MTTNEPVAPEVLSTGADDNRAAMMGVLSLALALVAASGGGTFTSAVQYWAFSLMSNANGSSQLAQAMAAVPAILLGVGAIVAGLGAARSPQVLASATGKAGTVLGVLAVVGGILFALAILTTDF